VENPIKSYHKKWPIKWTSLVMCHQVEWKEKKEELLLWKICNLNLIMRRHQISPNLGVFFKIMVCDLHKCQDHESPPTKQSTLLKTGVERDFLNLIKESYKNLHILHLMVQWNTPFKARNKKGYLLSLLLFNNILVVSANIRILAR
jgi:hypothetical protein